ncbi:MAG: fibronectin type III-like domain-contianing protein, partial [Synechococcaceae cyanobacterium]|nr:fibronectin type III-like domain-contianing protein [Synechococcaceae cyanobacterium]
FRHTDPEVAWLPTPAEEEAAVELAVTVTNTGTVEAAEVVQVYVEPPGEAVERPRRTLAGFSRVNLRPGGSQRVRIRIPLRRLAWFDPARDGFMLERGRHRLVVARHAEDDGIGVDLELDGRRVRT